MKIVTKKELMTMPIGTLFSHYKPVYFEGLCIFKGQTDVSKEVETLDFYYQDLIGNVDSDGSSDFIDKVTSGKSFELDFDSIERDGMYEEEDLYAVYERHEVESLIVILQSTLNMKKERFEQMKENHDKIKSISED